MENKKELKLLLDDYDNLPLECDGLTRVLSHVLTEQGIGHSCYFGSVSYDGGNQGIISHYWILTDSGFLIDYRLGLWLNEQIDKPLPKGPYELKNYPYVSYNEWIPVDLTITPSVFKILTVNKDYWTEVFTNVRQEVLDIQGEIDRLEYNERSKTNG